MQRISRRTVLFASMILVGCLLSDGPAAARGEPTTAQSRQKSKPSPPPPDSPVRPPAGGAGSQVASRPPAPRISRELLNQPGEYLRSKLGIWTPTDADRELGEPIRHRVTRDGRGEPVADVWAYKHPRYVQVELVFSRVNQRVTDVYFYPSNFTWAEAEKLFGSRYTTTTNKDGSTFRSYSEARTNLLVDRSGEVVSIGIY